MRKSSALNRRELFAIAAGCVMVGAAHAEAEADSAQMIEVSKDPNCGCCSAWVDHLKVNGFSATVSELSDMPGVKQRAGIPSDLSSCHTAQAGGYVIEGHVPAHAIKRLLAERPAAIGLAVPGMPAGSPGMSGTPVAFDVILFTKNGHQVFGRYKADQPV